MFRHQIVCNARDCAKTLNDIVSNLDEDVRITERPSIIRLEHNDDLLITYYEDRPAFVEATESGAPCAITDAARDMPVTSAEIAIPVTQESGTPAPDNYLAFTGYTAISLTHEGKNLWANGDVIIGTDGGSGYITLEKPLPAGTYTISAVVRTDKLPAPSDCIGALHDQKNVTPGSLGNFYLEPNSPARSYCTITIERPALYIRLYSAHTSAGSVGYGAEYKDIQIESGSEATSYEAPPKTYAFTFPEGAGTVYGGKLDAISGVLTVTHRFVEFDGTETWVKSAGEDDDHNCFYTTIDPNAAILSTSETPKYSLLENAQIDTTNTTQGGRVYNDTNWTRFACRFTGYTDITKEEFADFVASLKEAGTPLQAVFKLSDPVEYQLDPVAMQTMRGANSFASSLESTVTVGYWADPLLTE